MGDANAVMTCPGPRRAGYHSNAWFLCPSSRLALFILGRIASEQDVEISSTQPCRFVCLMESFTAAASAPPTPHFSARCVLTAAATPASPR